MLDHTALKTAAGDQSCAYYIIPEKANKTLITAVRECINAGFARDAFEVMQHQFPAIRFETGPGLPYMMKSSLSSAKEDGRILQAYLTLMTALDEVQDNWQSLIEYAHDRAEFDPFIAETLGRYYHSQGNFDKARPLLINALESTRGSCSLISVLEENFRKSAEMSNDEGAAHGYLQTSLSHIEFALDLDRSKPATYTRGPSIHPVKALAFNAFARGDFESAQNAANHGLLLLAEDGLYHQQLSDIRDMSLWGMDETPYAQPDHQHYRFEHFNAA